MKRLIYPGLKHFPPLIQIHIKYYNIIFIAKVRLFSNSRRMGSSYFITGRIFFSDIHKRYLFLSFFLLQLF